MQQKTNTRIAWEYTRAWSVLASMGEIAIVLIPDAVHNLSF